MKKKFGIAGALVAVGLSLAGVTGIAAPANAATVTTPPGNCSLYNFCLFQGGAFDGWVYPNSGNVPAVPVDRNDASDSLFNHGGSQNVFVYRDINYGGCQGWVQRGYGLTYLGTAPMGNTGLTWSNRISGFRWTTQTSNTGNPC